MEWAIGHMGAGHKGPQGGIRRAAAARTMGILPRISQRIRSHFESFLRRRNWRNCNNLWS